MGLGGVGGGGESRPIRPIAPVDREKMVAIKPTHLPAAGGLRPLKERISVPKDDGLGGLETASEKDLRELDEKNFFWAGFELQLRTLLGKVRDSSWLDEKLEAHNFGADLREAKDSPVYQLRLAIRYLVGLGTEAGEEAALQVIRGRDPGTGHPHEGWKDLSNNQTFNYQYYRYLREYRKEDASVYIRPLHKAAVAGNQRAKEILNEMLKIT